MRIRFLQLFLIAVLECSQALAAPVAVVDRSDRTPLLAAATAADQQKSAQLVAEAARLLDSYAGNWSALQQADSKLREALDLDPDHVAVYVEVARLRMKSSGLEPEALKAAEASLRRGLAIDPNFGNAYVLLGYVLTHSRRFDEAEAAFAKATQSGATSPWLESNQAELTDKRGQSHVAAESFTRIAAAPSKPVEVRFAALQWLQSFHTHKTKLYEQADLAHRTQIELAPDRPYPKGNYACFLRVYRLDVARAEEYARQALALMNYGSARRCLGLTLYLAWAEARAAGNQRRADELFAEASQLEPNLSALLHEVGDYPRAHPILEALVAKGIPLESLPGATTPLSIAAGNPDIEVAAAMIKLGANLNTQGYTGITALMAAAQKGNERMIRLLLSSGADPTLLTSDGRDAERFAIEANQLPIAAMLASAKKTYVRPAGPLTPTVPFRVGYAYRLKKVYEIPGSYDRWPQGEQYVFDHPVAINDGPLARFNFRNAKGLVKEFRVERAKLETWSEYFEEVGPGAPRPR